MFVGQKQQQQIKWRTVTVQTFSVHINGGDWQLLIMNQHQQPRKTTYMSLWTRIAPVCLLLRDSLGLRGLLVDAETTFHVLLWDYIGFYFIVKIGRLMTRSLLVVLCRLLRSMPMQSKLTVRACTFSTGGWQQSLYPPLS